MIKTVVIFGGSGFIGGYIVRRLSKLGYRIIVPTSSLVKANKLKVMGNVGQILPISFNSTKYENIISRTKKWKIGDVKIKFRLRRRILD